MTPRPRLITRRRTADRLKTLLALLLLTLGLDAEPLAFPTLTTSEGVTYKDVTVSRFDAMDLHISHATGVATVPLAELSPELQKLFGYDPKNESVLLTAKQRARARAIIEEADQKARAAAQREQERADAAELQSIRSSPLRCFVRRIIHAEDTLLAEVLAADKQPLKLKSRSGKYERVKLTPQGKPELVEQIVRGEPFALGSTLRILPKSAHLHEDAFTTVYLIAPADDVGGQALCALTPEDALTYRHRLAALKAKEQTQPVPVPTAPPVIPPVPVAPPASPPEQSQPPAPPMP